MEYQHLQKTALVLRQLQYYKFKTMKISFSWVEQCQQTVLFLMICCLRENIPLSFVYGTQENFLNSRQKVLDVAQSFASIFTAVVASSAQQKMQTEAQQNQGIESVTWIIFLTELYLYLF